MTLISHTSDTQLCASCLREKDSCALEGAKSNVCHRMQVAAGLEKFLGVE